MFILNSTKKYLIEVIRGSPNSIFVSKKVCPDCEPMSEPFCTVVTEQNKNNLTISSDQYINIYKHIKSLNDEECMYGCIDDELCVVTQRDSERGECTLFRYPQEGKGEGKFTSYLQYSEPLYYCDTAYRNMSVPNLNLVKG